jgi:hypothetical protein
MKAFYDALKIFRRRIGHGQVGRCSKGIVDGLHGVTPKLLYRRMSVDYRDSLLRK